MSSPLGLEGHDTLTEGIVSHTGRILKGTEVIVDQLSITSDVGSSGGMVFLKNGKCVGIMVAIAHAGEYRNFNIYPSV